MAHITFLSFFKHPAHPIYSLLLLGTKENPQVVNPPICFPALLFLSFSNTKRGVFPHHPFTRLLGHTFLCHLVFLCYTYLLYGNRTLWLSSLVFSTFFFSPFPYHSLPKFHSISLSSPTFPPNSHCSAHSIHSLTFVMSLIPPSQLVKNMGLLASPFSKHYPALVSMTSSPPPSVSLVAP